MANRGEWNIAQFCLLLIPTSLGYFNFADVAGYLYYFQGYGLMMSLLTLFVACFPALWLSYSLSGSTGKGLIGSLRRHIPVLQFSGWMVVIHNLLICLVLGYYCALSLYFIIYVIWPPSESLTCNNSWNSAYCVPASGHATTTTTTSTASYEVNYNVSVGDYNNYYDPYSSSEIEYITHLIHDPSSSPVKYSAILDGFHLPKLSLVGLVITWLVVLAFTCAGPASIGLASYIIGPLILVILVTIVTYGYTQINTDISWLQHYIELPSKENREWKVVELLEYSHWVVVILGIIDGTSFLRGKCSWHYPRWLLVLLNLLIAGVLSVAPIFIVGPFIKDHFFERQHNQYLSPLGTMMTILYKLRANVPKWVRCLYLLSAALVNLPLMAMLLLTLQDSVIEMLPLRMREIRRRRWIVNAIFSSVLCSVLFLISLIFFTRPGNQIVFNLIVACKHLTSLYILLLVTSATIAFSKTNRHRVERIVIGFFYCLFGVGFLLQTVSYFYKSPSDPALELMMWNSLSTTPTRQAVAWTLALLPIVLGLFIASVCLCCSRRKKSCSKVLCGVDDSSEHSSSTYQSMPLVEKN